MAMVMTTTFRNFAHSNSLLGLCTCMPNTFRVLLDVSARPSSRSSSISFRNSTLSLATQVAFLSFHIFVSHKPIYFRLFYYVLYSHSLVKLFFIFFFFLRTLPSRWRVVIVAMTLIDSVHHFVAPYLQYNFLQLKFSYFHFEMTTICAEHGIGNKNKIVPINKTKLVFICNWPESDYICFHLKLYPVFEKYAIIPRM